MPNSNQKEVIDTRILRLIGLEDVFDLDYETYLTLLKEAMVKGRMVKTSIPTEEVELLTNEYKRVKTKKDKGRFEVKEKKITANSFAVGKVSAKLGITRPKGLLPAAIGKSPITNSLTESIAAITSAVTSIAETLKAQKTLTDDATAFEKRKSEQDKRALAESKLEKRFDGLKKAAEKIIAPVKSLLDRVLEFFTTILLGRVVYKLIEWLGNPENANKVKTIGRFLGDHWPKLLALYLTFGTSFGRFALGLTKAVAKGAVKLAFAIAKLLAAKKVKGAMGAARFLGGGKGKLLAGVLGTGAALGGAYAVTQGLKGGEEEPKTQKYSGGGLAVPRFSGGGLNFKGMLGGASMGAMFGPLGMLLGGALGSGKPQEMVSGFVSGEKGVDKVPAMLSDGEFVMSAGAVRKYGVDTLEGMNAAGGGTNKPKVVSGTTYADGGGRIGRENYGSGANSNIPFAKDPIGAIGRFIKFKFGADLGSETTWGIPSSESKKPPSPTPTSTGSLLTDPVGAAARIASNMGIKIPSGSQSSGSGTNIPSLSGSKKGGFLNDLGSATYRDAGSIYAKQMLGGFGGPISESDLSGQSQAELQKAIQRAKKRTSQQMRVEQQKLDVLLKNPPKQGQDKSKWNDAVALQKSFLKKFKEGGIRVQYADYADEKGNISDAAKNSKNILGQFWANPRSSKEGGGYRIEDKYDFDMLKKKDNKTNKMRDMNTGELILEGILGKGKTIQQRLQAAHLLNPLKGKGDVDMVLGGERTAEEQVKLYGSKILDFLNKGNPLIAGGIGGILGMSGRSTPPKAPPKSVTMYDPNDPRRKQTGPYQSKFARPKNAGIKPVKPPTSAKPRVVYGPPVPQRRNVRGGRTSSTRTPSFNATTRGSSAKQQTLGLVG
jgi:hypothetical protein